MRLFRRGKEFEPILRRFFINTLFDSTFMQIGIIVGSAFALNPDVNLIIKTLIASSVALGISTGVSIYESETLERERRILELEKAMFRKLEDTIITEKERGSAILISSINFITPLVCCGIVIAPFLLAALGLLGIAAASWVSVALALIIIFAAGAYFGKQKPLIKGLRMAAFGGMAFAIGYLIQIII